MSSTDFYRAFEERHRGSRELIRWRLEVYRPFIQPLLDIYQPANAVDLGCGRGEWLELLQGAGFVPQGIDLDAGMLAACTERGLPGVQGDAIAHLKSLADESQCVVSGFHIAEHIAFEDLETLVIHSMRVLKPGGLLILETPNPENLVVGACSFFLDPTHLRPIPPLLLSFLPEHHGFARVRTVRLQESAELRTRSDIRMMDVLSGVSPDYAVVAQKAAAHQVMARFDAAFDAHYGIDLNDLADRYDGALNRRMDALHQRLAAAERQAVALNDALHRIASAPDHLQVESAQFVLSEAERTQRQPEAATALLRASAAEALALEHEQRAMAAEALAQDRHKRIDELESSAHHWWRQACTLEKERNALKQSASWRLTAPLRFVAGLRARCGDAVRSGVNIAIHRAINASHRPLSGLMAVAFRRPQLSHRISQWLNRHYPALHGQLVEIAGRYGVVSPAATSAIGTSGTHEHNGTLLTELSPRANRIYMELRRAIEIKRDPHANRD